ADNRLARPTRWNRLFLAGPSVTSKTVLPRPAASNCCWTSAASGRLKSYSQKPRALGAPGDSAVCPTSTTTRKAAWSQAERGDFFAGPPAPSAHAHCHAPGHATSAATTVATSPIRRRKAIKPAPTPLPASASLIGLRQAENLLCNEIEDHMWRNWRDPRDQDLAQIALDVEFLRITHAAVGHDRGLAGVEGGLRGQILGGIGLGGAIQVAIVEGRRFHHHQVRCFQLHPALRERMRDCLILADGPPKDHTLAGIARGFAQGREADADRLRGDEDAFWIHAVQDRAKALPLRADAIGRGDGHSVEKHLV